MQCSRRGFTLVEISIVLVIIGLLIGGLLTAQSMISTTKIAAAVAQIHQFDAGVMSFKSSYGYLPGDAPAFGGDGDGVIDMTAASGADNYVTVMSCELANFWNAINPTAFVHSSVCTAPGIKPVSTGGSKNVPISKLGSANSYFVASALSANGGIADVSNPQNYYVILSATQAKALSAYGWYHFQTSTPANSAVTPADLLALDRKTDDGLADAGVIRSGSIGTQPGTTGIGGIIATPAAGICSSGATYTVAHPGYECTPLIRIGGQTGNLQ